MEQLSISALIGSVLETAIAIVVLVSIAWNVWLHYIIALYLRSIEWVMLEVTPPKDVFKSPEAMELVLNSLHGGDATNWFLKYWKGEVGQYYSLEIASIEGKIHFFVRFHKKYRKVFEAMLYSQYPQAEVKEVEDYTARVPDYVKGGPIGLFAYNLVLAKDDPYPIKTYIDYGLDRAIGSLDEEQRIDPITPLLETMGSIGIGEQIWVQINIRKDTKRFTIKNEKGEVESNKSWKDKGREIIRDLQNKLDIKDAEGKVINTKRSTRGQQDVIESIERHLNKPGFDAGIRVMYVANKDHFSGNTITAFTSMFRQFNSEDLNGFKADNMTRPPDEPWKDIGNRKLEKKKKDFMGAYKSRAFFYGGFDKEKPWKILYSNPWTSGGKAFLLTTEEIATLYHLPGRVASTPTFIRSDATKAEPPANLPV
jgi:hypothetical protein